MEFEPPSRCGAWAPPCTRVCSLRTGGRAPATRPLNSARGQQAGAAGAAWEGLARVAAPNPGLPRPPPARPSAQNPLQMPSAQNPLRTPAGTGDSARSPALPSARSALEASPAPGPLPRDLGPAASLSRGLTSGADPLWLRSGRGQGQPAVGGARRAAARPRATSRARGRPPHPLRTAPVGASGGTGFPSLLVPKAARVLAAAGGARRREGTSSLFRRPGAGLGLSPRLPGRLSSPEVNCPSARGDAGS